MKALFTITLLFIAVLLSGCLGSSSSSTAPTLAFLYVVGQGDNAIHALAEKTTGDLFRACSVLTFPTMPRPVSIALHPSKKFSLCTQRNFQYGFRLIPLTTLPACSRPLARQCSPTPVCQAEVCVQPDRSRREFRRPVFVRAEPGFSLTCGARFNFSL